MEKLILLADPDELSRKILGNILKKKGYILQVVSDGQEALDSMVNSPPDLIISELMMPRIDGLALRYTMINNPLLKNVDHILISHKKNEETLKRTGSLDIAYYFRKPYMSAEILAAVSFLFKRQNS